MEMNHQMQLFPIQQPNRHYHEQLLSFFKIVVWTISYGQYKISSKTILQQRVSKQLQHIQLHTLDIDSLDHIQSQ